MSTFTPEQIVEQYSKFVDKDHDGFFSKAELKGFFEYAAKLGRPFDEAKFNAKFDLKDVNHDGKLSKDELLHFLIDK
mgnify:CR=1 FL=1